MPQALGMPVQKIPSRALTACPLSDSFFRPEPVLLLRGT